MEKTPNDGRGYDALTHDRDAVLGTRVGCDDRAGDMAGRRPAVKIQIHVIPRSATASATLCGLRPPERFALDAARGPVARRTSNETSESGMRMAWEKDPSGSLRSVTSELSPVATAMGDSGPGRRRRARTSTGWGSVSPRDASSEVDERRT